MTDPRLYRMVSLHDIANVMAMLPPPPITYNDPTNAAADTLHKVRDALVAMLTNAVCHAEQFPRQTVDEIVRRNDVIATRLRLDRTERRAALEKALYNFGYTMPEPIQDGHPLVTELIWEVDRAVKQAGREGGRYDTVIRHVLNRYGVVTTLTPEPIKP